MTEQPRTLIVYYSFEGNTRYVAEKIADELSADLLELRTDDQPGTKGFMKFVWGGQQVIMKKTPKLEPLARQPEEYDLLIIGTPVWAFDYTPAVRTFLGSVALRGKRVAVFATHQGGPGRTLANMERALAGNTLVGKIDFAFALRNSASTAEAARRWARELLSD